MTQLSRILQKNLDSPGGLVGQIQALFFPLLMIFKNILWFDFRNLQNVGFPSILSKWLLDLSPMVV